MTRTLVLEAYRAFYEVLQAVRSLKLFSLAALYDANKDGAEANA